MCSCAPGYFRLDLFSILFRVIALELVKFCNFQLVSHVTQEGFDQEAWNFTGILITMCSCAPGYFRLYSFSIFLELLPSAYVVVHFRFRLWIYLVFVELLLLT
jgi:hypothetical protein